MSIYDDDSIKRITIVNRRDYRGWEVSINDKPIGYFHEHSEGLVIGEAARWGCNAKTFSSLGAMINAMIGEPEEEE